MAARKVKQPTDRITVRLPISQIEQMNALVGAGRFRTTTDVIFTAVRDFLTAQGAGAKEVIASEQGMLEYQILQAKADAARAKLGLK
ncbi:MAG: ribbon-helix-helix domain-containing protein [Thermoplasmatota archaeon]|nr:ribbon-helix-helix domain-containing protein [Halobacteriales archaeon]